MKILINDKGCSIKAASTQQVLYWATHLKALAELDILDHIRRKQKEQLIKSAASLKAQK